MDDLNAAIGIDLEAAAAKIDGVVDALRRGVVTAGETVEAIKHATYEYMCLAVASAEDVDLLIDYARSAVRDVAWGRDVMDLALIEHFEEFLRGQVIVGDIQLRLDLLLDPLVARAAGGDGDAREEIADLCRNGFHSHRLLLSLSVSAGKILRAAYSVRCAVGLRDAVSPQFRGQGQIADRDRSIEDYLLALNLLAHLAADPDEGAQARSALIDLAEHVEPNTSSWLPRLSCDCRCISSTRTIVSDS